MAFNPGLAVLKLIAAFAVVWIHFGLGGGRLTSWSVPLFVFLSFYLTGAPRDGIIRRLGRLARPFLFWSVVTWLVCGAMGVGWSLTALGLQCVTGHTVCPPLYYVVEVLVMTVAFGLIARLKRWREILIGLTLCCWVAQYTGLNHALFGSLGIPFRYTLGRFAELMPSGVLGVLAHDWVGCHPLRFSRRGLHCCAAGVILGLLLSQVLDRGVAGFAYAGVGLVLQAAGLTGAFALVGQRFVGRLAWLKVCGPLSAFVYFSHFVVGWALMRVWQLSSGLMLAVIVFGLCAGAAIVVCRFGWTRRLMF